MPVHSEVLVRPWVPWTVFSFGPRHSVSPLPEHSMKWKRETDGETQEIRHRVLHGPVHHPVHDEGVAGGVDVGNAAVVALEVQPGRGDDAVSGFERGHGPGRFLGGGGEAPPDLGLELRPGPVPTVVVGEPPLDLGGVVRHRELDGAGRCGGLRAAGGESQRGASGHGRGRGEE